MNLLKSHNFPGNVRELISILEELQSLIIIDESHDRTGYLKAILDNKLHLIKAEDIKFSETEKICKLIIEKRISFWDAAYIPYKKRHITREQLIEIIAKGLSMCNYSWHRLIKIFNLNPCEYKKFLNVMKNVGITLSQFKPSNYIAQN